jgi:hypothetical protein
MKKTTTKNTKTTKAAAAASSGVAAAKPVRKAPAKKPAVRTTRTTITAQIDVGFGNALYIRGEGPGLSWDKGIMMDCVADDKWVITLSDAAKPVVFKFLLNDITWCVGDDCAVDPGASMTTVPVF